MRKELFAFIVAAPVLVGCQVNPFTGEEEVSNTATEGAKGSAIGAAVGAGVGAVASGGDKKAVKWGAGAGAVIGALLGANQGRELDRQEALLREKLQSAGVSVNRRGDNIVLNLAKSLTFAPGETEVDENGQQTLEAIKEVLVEFEGTTIDIFGYTDDRGSETGNRAVSLERARNVAYYLMLSGVSSDRLRFHGRGEAEPIAPNDTAEGRAANRRVELHIAPIA